MALVFAGLTIPAAAALNSVAAPRGLSAAGARALVPLIYGQDRADGLILNVLLADTDSTTLLVQVLWCHACNAVGTLRLNDKALSSGSSATNYTGSQVSADSALVTAFAAQGITYTDTLAGYAYSVISMPVREFDGQLSFSALIEGRKLYDPRLDSTNGGAGSHRLATPSTWAYSTNPSLALADWLYSSTYGANDPPLWSSVITAANANDALVGSPSETHRRIGVTLKASAQVPEVAEALRAYAGVWMVPTSGGVKLLPDTTAASSATYSHASGQIAAIGPLSLRDLGNSPTAVEVVYTNTSQVPYRDASAVASLAGAGTTLPWRQSTVRLPGIQRYGQALREATERLNKLTLSDLSTTLEVFDVGIAHEVGDVVTVSHPVGLVSKLFRISAPPEMAGPGRWRLPLAEYDPAVYSTTVATGPTYTDAGLNISNGALTAGGNLVKNSSFEAEALDYWTSPDYGTNISITAGNNALAAMHGRYALYLDVTAITSPTSKTTHELYQAQSAEVMPLVQPGATYQLGAWFQCTTTTYRALIGITWLDASFAALSTTRHDVSLAAANTWQQVQMPVLTAPASAKYACVGVGIKRPATTDTTLGTMRVDSVMLQAGDTPTGYAAADVSTLTILPGAATQNVRADASSTSIYSGAAVSSLSSQYVDGPTFTTARATSRVFGSVSGRVSATINTASARFLRPSFVLQLVRTSDGAVMDESGDFSSDTRLIEASGSNVIGTSAALVFDAVAAGTYKVRLKVSVVMTDAAGTSNACLTALAFTGEVSGVEFKA